MSSPRRAAALSLVAAVAMVTVAPVAGPSAAAASRTTKTTRAARTAVAAKSPATATVTTRTVVPTTLPKPRRAGTPLSGWSSVTEAEWPDPGNAVAVHPSGRSVIAYRTPDDTTGGLQFNEGSSVYGRVTLLVVGSAPGWWKVLLPVRPNGTVGWVRTDAVNRVGISQRIVLELDTNTMTFFENGKTVVRTKVAAGTGGTPTPRGLFYVKEIVPQPNRAGALGPVALGLSGFSTVLYSFAGGDGVIGIHGTSAPGRLGQNVSHGCVRVLNEHISMIASKVALGTPVEIVDSLGDLPSDRFLVPALSDLAGPTTTVGSTTTVGPGTAGATTTTSGPITTVGRDTSA